MLEARKARRYDCNEGVDCELEGQVSFGLLRDVSITGARLRGLKLPAVGSLFRVSPALNGARRDWVFCQVCWVSRGAVEEAGVRFLEPAARLQALWVGELCAVEDPFERREAVRLPVEIPVQLKSIGKSAVVTSSVDLSRDGAMVLALQNLRRNERVDVNLRLPSTLLELSAVVVEPGSPTRANHSVRFVAPSSRALAHLDTFLTQNRPAGRVGGNDGLALLKLMNKL